MKDNKKRKVAELVSYLLIAITVAVPPYIPIIGDNPIIGFLFQILLLFVIFYNRSSFFGDKLHKIVKLYFFWAFICIIRGLLIADNYIEYKQLLIGSLGMLTPIVIFLFNKPAYVANIYSKWVRGLVLIIVLLICLGIGLSELYVSPLLLLCFYAPLFKKRKRIILFFFLILFIINDLEARSQIIKGGLVLIALLCIYFDVRVSNSLLKKIHVASYLSVLILFGFILADSTQVIFGNLTVEEAQSHNNGKDANQFDTRSLLLVDVFNSAVENKYFIYGNTPARGFEYSASTDLFVNQYDNEKTFNKGERHKNEMGLTNIFTWCGLIGLILYTMVYIKASSLAIYHSNNTYIKYLACYVGFCWAYGWVEFPTNFASMDIALWVMIALCYSEKIRSMSNEEFKNWIPTLWK
jgi:hypothetical protein